MKYQEHVISKQIFKVYFPVNTDYWLMQNKISGILQKSVYPKLGVICDKHSRPNIHHRINKLEIDLRQVTLSNLKTVLVEQIPKQFETALIAVLKKTQKKEEAVSIKKQALEIQQETIEYFLKTGTLPWWKQSGSKKTLTDLLIALATEAPGKVKLLVGSLNENSMARLILQQTDDQLLAIIKTLLLDSQQSITKLHNDISLLFSSTNISSIASFSKIRQRYWSFILSFVLKQENTLNTVLFTNYLISYMAIAAYRVNFSFLAAEMLNAAQKLIKHGISLSQSLISCLKETVSKAEKTNLPSYDQRTVTSKREDEQLDIELVVNERPILLKQQQELAITHGNLVQSLFDLIRELENIIAMPLDNKDRVNAYYLQKTLRKYATRAIVSLSPSNIPESLLKAAKKLIDSLELNKKELSNLLIDRIGSLKTRYLRLENYNQERLATSSMTKEQLESESAIDNTMLLKQKQELVIKPDDLVQLLFELSKELESIITIPLDNKDRANVYYLQKILRKCASRAIISISPSNIPVSLLRAVEKLIDSLELNKKELSDLSACQVEPLKSQYLKLKNYHQERLKFNNNAKRINDSTSLWEEVQRENNKAFISANETIYIENAGLILYWVYLKNLFAKIGFLNENKLGFLNKKLAIRATLLLNNLLGNGAEEIPEYELTLNKILCGIPIEQPLPGILHFKPVEKQECENVTTALIAHWIALGKISLERFSQIFLQRKGAIKQRDGQWLLQVEKKPQDVLLNKLPWPIQVIQLPWMENIMIVEW